MSSISRLQAYAKLLRVNCACVGQHSLSPSTHFAFHYLEDGFIGPVAPACITGYGHPEGILKQNKPWSDQCLDGKPFMCTDLSSIIRRKVVGFKSDLEMNTELNIHPGISKLIE